MAVQVEKLHEFDYVLLFIIASNRANKATASEIVDGVREVYGRLYQKVPPTYSYTYHCLVRLSELGFLEKQGPKVYRIRRDESYDTLCEYVRIHMVLRGWVVEKT